MMVAVIGAGSWGTALSEVLASNGHDVRLWARKPEVVAGVNEQHRNPRYLVDVTLSESIVATTSFDELLEGTGAIGVVTPSHLLRSIAETIAPRLGGDLPVLICSKGVEEGTGMLPVEVFRSVLGSATRTAVLSGPNHAEEVVRAQPSATVIASDDEPTAVFFRDLLASETFRTYTSDDPVGVELCAAFKNVIAIAVGVSYGLGFGDNTASLLITRGLAEMSRMTVACGGQALTCMGLAGAGDMVATCMSRHSRNRRFGQDFVALGKSLDDFEREFHMVVEGALACKTLACLADRTGVELPLTDTVRSIVWEGADAREAAKALAYRPLKSEFYGI